MFTLRFDMRLSLGAATDLYAAAIEMCAWAETRGAVIAVLSEHHGTDDGHLPAPHILAAAIAARTKQLAILLAAVPIPFLGPRAPRGRNQRPRHHQQGPRLVCLRYRPPRRGIRALRNRHAPTGQAGRRVAGAAAAAATGRAGRPRRSAYPRDAPALHTRGSVHVDRGGQQGRRSACGEVWARVHLTDRPT